MKILKRVKDLFAKGEEPETVSWFIQEIGTGYIDGAFVDEKTPDLLRIQRERKQYWDSIRPEYPHLVVNGLTLSAWRNMRAEQLTTVMKKSWVRGGWSGNWRGPKGTP